MNSLHAAVYIAAGGALGTLARYLCGVGAQRALGDSLPYGTLLVNVLGSFAIGYAMVHFSARGQLDSHVRVALTVGFLGGFTTYSSFAYETVTMLHGERIATAAGYVVGTLVIAGTACALGMLLARSAASG
jgi:CrcB protein